MAQKRHEVEIGQERGIYNNTYTPNSIRKQNSRHTNGKAEYLEQDLSFTNIPTPPNFIRKHISRHTNGKLSI